jgi:butyryl-CoA dehydrogenase
LVNHKHEAMLPYIEARHEELRRSVQEFADSEIAPIAERFDRESRFPWDTVRRMAGLGWFGVNVPEAYGGLGLDYLSYILVLEGLARVDVSHAMTVSAHSTLCLSPILNFGTEAQKQRFIPLLASGRVLGGFGLTEPAAGSDASATRTAAVRENGGYRITGSKIFITHAGVGEIFVVTAVTARGEGARGITSFIVTKETVDRAEADRVGIGHAPDLEPYTPGVRSGKKEDKMGWRASDTRELVFEDAVVPKENLLGKPGYGFINFLKTLDGGRIGIAALSLGIAEGAYEEALRYAGVRKQFGRFIGSFQAVSFQLADMALEIEAGTHLLYHAAWLKQNGRPFKKEAAMAKLYCSELAMRTTTKAVQIFGGYGYTTEYPVERMMRDAKVCEIGEGTSEIQRIVIARQILGEVVD